MRRRRVQDNSKPASEVSFFDARVLRGEYYMFNILQGKAFFFNSLSVKAVVTITFTAGNSAQTVTLPISNVPPGANSGPTVITLVPGQTATVVFDVAANGGYLVNVGSQAGQPANMTYQIEDILWGHG